MLKYRTAVTGDLSAINDILDLSFERIYAHYAKKSYAGLENAIVAEENAGITGAINYRVFDANDKKVGYLYYMAVHPNHRRKGVGRGLVKQAVDAIEKGSGKLEIYAVVEKKNAPSRELVKNFGFEPVSRSAVRKKYGKGTTKLFRRMNLMPWEELFVLPVK